MASAPQRLVPPLADQPISGQDGRPSYPMVQWMQRISAQVGPVTSTSSGGSGSSLSLSEQVSNLTTTVNALVASSGSTDASVSGQIQQLWAAIKRQVFTPADKQPKPLAAPPPWQPMPMRPPTPPPPLPTLPIRRDPPPMLFQAAALGVTILANGTRISDGYGAPNSVVYGSVGDLYAQRDGTASAGVLWVKVSGSKTNTGWQPVTT